MTDEERIKHQTLWARAQAARPSPRVEHGAEESVIAGSAAAPIEHASLPDTTD